MANITTVKELAVKIAEMRKAQQIFSSYSQAQVDKICHAVATAAIQARISLAKLAVQETQMGILEDKILKNHIAAIGDAKGRSTGRACGCDSFSDKPHFSGDF